MSDAHSTQHTAGATTGRRRAAPRQPFSWLGVGALTVGVGAAALGAGTGVACADTPRGAASSPAPASPTAAPAASSSAGARGGATARTIPVAKPAASAKVSLLTHAGTPTPAVPEPAAAVTAAVSRTVSSAAAAASAVPLSVVPVVVHPSVLLPAKLSAAPAVLRSAASTPAAATTPAAVVTTTVVSPAASVAVSPLQKVLNAVTNALLRLGGLNPTTPTPAPGNTVQLALYSVARRLQDTFNPGGIPKAVGTITVGTPDPTTGALSFNPKIFTTTSGAPLTYQISVDPTLGKVTVNSDGVYTFTPTTAERLLVGPDGGTVKLNLIVYNGVQTTNQVINAQVNPAVLTLGPTTISVGKYPIGLAVSPNGSELVVTNSNAGAGGTVSVIDTHTDTVTATLPGGQDPVGVAISPDGLTAYVANNDNSGAVSVVSLADNTVTGNLNAYSFPYGVAVGPANSPAAGRIYVTNYQYVYLVASSANVHQVSVLNTATKAAVAGITVGTVNPTSNGPTGVAVSPDGTRVYVANTEDGTVSVINTATNTVTATIPVGATDTNTDGATGVAVSPDGTHVYVTNTAAGTVSVISTATNKVTATIPVPQILGDGSVPYDIAVSPDGSVVYVTGTTVNTQTDAVKSTVSVINTSTNTVITTIPVSDQSGSAAVAVSPDGTQLYVTNTLLNTGDGTVSVVSV